MFASIFIGLSGMRSFSAGLKQISNNITNINSTGFKASRLGFTDLFGAGGLRGGQGVALNPPRLDFAQGELRQSDRDLDLAIDGDGFLVLLKDADQYFTRTGSFEVNEDGDIVLAGTDYKLTMLDASGRPVAISVEAQRTSPPQATTRISFADNLSNTGTSHTIGNIQVYDASGEAQTWSARFERAATDPAGEWNVIVTAGGTTLTSQKLKFINEIVDPLTSSLTFAHGSRAVTFDFGTSVRSYSSGEISTLRVTEADGYAAGEISTIKVNDQGQLEVTYTNEQKLQLGDVTVAHFENPQDLSQRGAGLFIHEGTGLSFLTSRHDKVGRVLSGRTEASNVDLSSEFGDLILVQRGFQASSQVVSVSNDMIQQLFGIRGQG